MVSMLFRELLGSVEIHQLNYVAPVAPTAQYDHYVSVLSNGRSLTFTPRCYSSPELFS